MSLWTRNVVEHFITSQLLCGRKEIDIHHRVFPAGELVCLLCACGVKLVS